MSVTLFDANMNIHKINNISNISNKTSSSNNEIEGEELDLDSFDLFDEYNDVSNIELSQDRIDYYTEMLSDEEKYKEKIGKMSEKEYKEFVVFLKNEYSKRIDEVDKQVDFNNTELKDINNLLKCDEDTLLLLVQKEENYKKEIDSKIVAAKTDLKTDALKEYGITEEDVKNKSVEELKEMVINSSKYQNTINDMHTTGDRILQNTLKVYSQYSKFEGYTYNDILLLREYHTNMLTELNATMESLKNSSKTAPYDHIHLLEGYNDFEASKKITATDIKDYSSKKTDQYGLTFITIDYNAYLKDHPGTSPLEFARAVKQIQDQNPTAGNNIVNIQVSGMNNYDDYSKLIEIEEYQKNVKTGKEYPIPLANPDIDYAKIYDFLYQQNPEKAVQYMEDISSVFNQYDGACMATNEINELGEFDYNNPPQFIMDYLNVAADGVGDGIYDFGEGFVKLFADGELSAQDYKVMMYMSYLEQNDKRFGGLLSLNKFYEGGQAVGMMLPVVTASALFAGAAPELAAASVAGTNVGQITSLSLMGLSTFGTTQNQLKYEGYSDTDAYTYALLAAGSEAIFEKYGGLIGLADVPGATVVQRLLKEGGQEAAQEIFQQVIGDHLLLGKEINLEGLTKDAFNSFVMGVIVSGSLNGYTKTLTLTINGASYNLSGKDQKAIASLLDGVEDPSKFKKEDFIKIIEYSKEHNVDIEAAIEELCDKNLIEESEKENNTLPSQVTLNENNEKNITKNNIDYDKEISDDKIIDLEEILNTDKENSKIKNILKTIIIGKENASSIINENIKYLIDNLQDIYSKNKVQITSYDMGSAFGGAQLNIDGDKALNSIKLTFMDFFHESGHAMHRLTPKEITNLTQNEIEIFKQARENFTLTQDRKNILFEINKGLKDLQSKAVEEYLSTKSAEEEKIINLVDNMTNEQHQQIKEMLEKFIKFDIIKNDLANLDIQQEDINKIMDNKEILKKILKKGNNISNYIKIENDMSADYNNYGMYRKLTSMLNSLLMTQKSINLGSEEFNFNYSHSDEYFKEKGIDSSFGELMADYFSIQASGNQELIDKVRILLGDDVIGILDSKYESIAKYMKGLLNNYNSSIDIKNNPIQFLNSENANINIPDNVINIQQVKGSNSVNIGTNHKPIYSPYSQAPLEVNEKGELYSKYDPGKVFELRDEYVVPKNYPEGFYREQNTVAIKDKNGFLEPIYSPYSQGPLEVNEKGELYSKYEPGKVFELRDGYVVPKNYPEGFYRKQNTVAIKDKNGFLEPIYSPYSQAPLEVNEKGELYSKYDPGKVYELRDGYVVPTYYPDGLYCDCGAAIKNEYGRLKKLYSPYSQTPLEVNEYGKLYSKYENEIYDISKVIVEGNLKLSEDIINKIHSGQEKIELRIQQDYNLYKSLLKEQKQLFNNLSNRMNNLKEMNLIPINYTFMDFIDLEKNEELLKIRYKDMYDLYHESGESFSQYMFRTSNTYKNIYDYNNNIKKISEFLYKYNLKDK